MYATLQVTLSRLIKTFLYLMALLRIPATVFTVLVAAMLATAGSSRADVSNEDLSGNLMGLGIEQLMEIEVSTVSGVSRYDQKITDAPASVSIVTADEIRKFGYRNLPEILRSVRGFYLSYDRQYHYLGIRGFSPPGDYNSRVLLLVDGQRLNNNIYDQAPLGADFPLDIDLIERVEVIRGPSSSMYGSSAFFGVINIITRKGKDLKKIEVATSGGSLDTYQGRLTYGNRLENGLELMLSGTASYSGGNPSLFYGEFATPDQNYGIAQNRDRGREYRLYGQFSLGDFTLTGAYSARYKQVPTGYYETVLNSPNNWSDDNYGFVNLVYRRQFDDLSELTAKVSYNNFFNTANYAYAGATPADPVSSDTDGARGESLEGEIHYTRRLFAQHLMTAGVDYRDNIKQNQTYTSATTLVLDDNRTSSVLGVYAQDEYTPFNSLIFSLGVRYDHYTTFGGTTSPRLGIIYKPLDTTVFKLLYGQAFRAPNVYELYYSDGLTGKANPNLQPEKITTYELVYDQYFGRHLRSSLSGFYYQCRDLIIQTVDPTDGLAMFSNIGKVEAKGIEAELLGAWANGLQGRLSYSYQNARNSEADTSLVNSPHHLAKLNLTLPLYAGKLFLSPEIQYYGPRSTVAGGTAGGFVISNLTLFSKDLLSGLELSGSVYNLFDKQYGDPTPGLPQNRQDVLGQDGRTFRVKITYRF